MAELDTAAGVAADPTAPGAGPTGSQPDYKALWEAQVAETTRFKDKFTGLQGKYQQEQSRWTQDTAKLTGLEATLQVLTGDKEALSLQLNTVQTEKAAKEKELEKAQSRVGRFELLATEFPQLLPFEAKGLLPEAPVAELKPKLQTFAEQLKALGAGELAAFKAGATPPAPNTPPANSPEALKAAAFKASREGKVEDYNRLMDEYYKATKAS